MSLKFKLQFLPALLLLVAACTNRNESPAPAPEGINTDNTLTVAEAKHYVKNYEKRSPKIDSVFIDPVSGKTKVKKVQDTRAVWFGIERLKALVAKIEAEGGDGIRFYYATYDQNYEGIKGSAKPPVKPYWNHNTLVMVSTKDSAGRHQDYYTDQKVKNRFHGFIINATPENRGEMCPPPINCEGTGATLVEQSN